MDNDVYIYRAPWFRGDNVANLMGALRYSRLFVKENCSTIDYSRSGREFVVSGERAADLVNIAQNAYGGTFLKVSN